MTKRPGYILVLTLLIVSLAVGLVTAIVRQSFSYRRQLCFSFEKNKARMLALSSLELALAQLSLVLPKETTQKASNQQAKPPAQAGKPASQAGEKKDKVQQWAEKVLPLLNRWQTFDFDGKADLEGTIRLYLASEDGKINLASLEKSSEQPPQQQQAQPQKGPAQTQAPSQQGQKPAQQPVQKGAQQNGAPQGTPQKDLLTFVDKLFLTDKEVSLKNGLKDFKNRYKRPLDDPSELLQIRTFEPYKDRLFMTPESAGRTIFLMDLFTVTSADGKINPFLASRSFKKLVGFAEGKDTKALTKGIKSSFNWATDWDKIIAPVYGKTYSALDQELKDMLGTSFRATSFSVLSVCKVGAVTQKMYALIEAADVGEEFSPESMIYRVSRIYWL